ITAAEKDKKTSPLTIKAGIMDGAVQSVEEVKALADILPREQLIAKIMGCLNSQATALAYVIQAIADKKAEAGEQ
ncbi:MAG: 50S ribosomal protein L10, partial [Christensenellales bacterium]